ncbi:MAG: glycosyltransferase [Pacificimonas sp.]
MTADANLFEDLCRDVEIVSLPQMIGAPSRTDALHDQPTPLILHCVPLGVDEQRRHMATIAATLDRIDPALFVVDVSAEIAVLSRILSVPAISIRMHGDRLDPGHLGAYEASVGMLAPFDETIEQDDYPDALRRRTFYSGGLCTGTAAIGTKTEARAALGLDPNRRTIVVMTGGGGSGSPWAPLTMAARADPDALFLAIGPVHREGHETEFANLKEVGWTDRVTDYLIAADIVVASAGDNTVHEIARIGRPFICTPEWRYFAEQQRKSEQLARVGAAIHMPVWPGSLGEWNEVLRKAEALDLHAQATLFDPDAAAKCADWLERTATALWSS